MEIQHKIGGGKGLAHFSLGEDGILLFKGQKGIQITWRLYEEFWQKLICHRMPCIQEEQKYIEISRRDIGGNEWKIDNTQFTERCVTCRRVKVEHR